MKVGPGDPEILSDEKEPNVEPGLAGILSAKDRRVERLRALLREHRKPVVSFTLVMPGPEKTGPRSRLLHTEGLAALHSALTAANLPVIGEVVRSDLLGPEAYLAVSAEAGRLKALTLQIEENHPWGRLFDLDVLDERGERLSRTAFGFPERSCLVCERPAAVCYREKTHTAVELLAAVHKILQSN
jgi:holo-ACP synthase